jgi:lactoylglutathione lyase
MRMFATALALAAIALPAAAQEVPKNRAPTNVNRVGYTLQPVNDLQRAVDFYTKGLGMRITRAIEVKERRFREVNLAFDDKGDSSAIILAHTEGKPVDTEGQVTHMILQVKDIRAAVKSVAAAGGKVTRPPPEKAGPGGATIALVEDPDGYKIELLQLD